MLPNFDAATDPTLLNLKQIATKGGERGPLYDQGVLSVIRQIEQCGYYTPDRTAGVICLLLTEQNGGPELLTKAEREKAQRLLKERGWTLKQAVEYFDGIECAEKLMFHLKKNEE
jgi:hypothetical protein